MKLIYNFVKIFDMRFLIITLLFSYTISFSQNLNNKIFDQKYNDSLIVGICNENIFKTEPYSNWFFTEHNTYIPDYEIVLALPNVINEISITIVLGVWCSDSRREFPRFMKVLDLINFNKNNLQIIAVNTQKDAILSDISEYNITKIPTFIFYKNNKEIGRIVETPTTNLEYDFLNIANLE